MIEEGIRKREHALGENNSVPSERVKQVLVPTLVMSGSASPSFMHETAQALSKAIPNWQLRIMEGQTHDVALEALAPVLVDFFTG